MSPEAAVAWHVGRRTGRAAGECFPREAVIAYVDAHPDAALPWSPEQANTVGFCVGLMQAINGLDVTCEDAHG